MAHAFIKTLLLLTISSILLQHKSDGQLEDWCIADEQTPDEELQRALVWACENGADCSKIEANQPCFQPNTVKNHASFAFNSYFQRMKSKGATCYFNSAAFVTDLDPSINFKMSVDNGVLAVGDKQHKTVVKNLNSALSFVSDLLLLC